MPADSAANDHKEVGSNQGVQAALTALMQSAQRTVAQHFVAAQIGAEAPVTPALVVNHLVEAAERAIYNVLYRGTGLARATQPELEALSMRNLTKSTEGCDGLKGELKQLLELRLPQAAALRRALDSREGKRSAHKPATEQTGARFKVRKVIHGHTRTCRHHVLALHDLRHPFRRPQARLRRGQRHQGRLPADGHALI